MDIAATALETDAKFITLARRLKGAEEAAARAAEELAQERARIQRAGLFARLKSWFVDSPSQEADEEARQQLVNVRHDLRTAIPALLRSRVDEAIDLAGLRAKVAELAARRDEIRSRTNRLQPLREKARAAHSALIKAADDCSSASTFEMFDAVSSNKGLSLLSTLETSDANDSLKEAKRALQALAAALPKRAEADPLSSVDDTLDLVVDFIFDPGIDLFSVFNMFALDSAEDECREAAEKVQKLLDRLSAITAGIERQAAAQQVLIDEVESPFFQECERAIPERLRQYAARMPRA